MNPVDGAKSLLLRVAWVAAAAIIAAGAAGIVAGMDHVPGTGSRPELTWAGDQAVEPALGSATDRLELLGDDVADLAATARAALSNVNSLDIEALEAAMRNGEGQVAAIRDRAHLFAADVAGVPFVGENAALHVSPALRTRYRYLAEATTLTANVGTAWAAFDARAVTAARLAMLLTRHDEETAAAATTGTQGRYADALAQLAKPDATIAETRSLIEQIRPTTDVTTLVDWVDRNAAYDAALRALYAAVIEADGRATSKVKNAINAEQGARANLPPDTRGLVLIMSSLAQGGINQAIVQIERTRGQIQGAVQIQRELEAGVALPQ